MFMGKMQLWSIMTELLIQLQKKMLGSVKSLGTFAEYLYNKFRLYYKE
jgi:hypothetical protein